MKFCNEDCLIATNMLGDIFMDEINLSKKIYHCAIQCGFDNCGIISVNTLDEFKEFLRKRVSNVPESKAFYENVGSFRDIKKRFPWAKSIVILTFNYGKYRFPKELQGKYAKAFFLSPSKNGMAGFDLERFEQWFTEHEIRAEGGEHVGIGPLRYMAAKAGLGIIRKNNFFYTEDGSYNNLIGYVIDKECELIQSVSAIPCGEKCDLCQKACKTKALQSPYTMNPLKCVSFWTTFGNSDIPQGLSPEMFEEWVCGCDNCQDACPYNRGHDWSSGECFPNLAEIAPMIQPQEYEHLSDEFLIKQVISRTADHLQASDVQALRKNANRAYNYSKTMQNN